MSAVLRRIVADAGRGAPRPLRVLLVALLAAGSLALPAATPARAATPDLTLVTAATYTVDPGNAKVAISVDVIATNHKADTTTRRYYFDKAYLAVLPGTSGFAVHADGTTPRVAVSRHTSDYTLLLLSFGTKLYSGKSLTLHLTFDLKDPGGAPARDVRVGQALVTFPIWAFASDSTAGSSVTVVVPAGYTVQFPVGELSGPTTLPGGDQVFRTAPLTDPLSFFAYLVADRPGAYSETTISPTIGGRPAPLVLRAWADDPAWSKRVGDLLEQGLPTLGDEIGLPYTRTDPLTVQESVSRTLGGYAGLFDPAAGRIDIDYAAGAFVILHEAAHVWFNGSLLADRWADEAFASYYAGLTATAIGVDASPDPLTPELEKSKIPLNAWGAVGQAPEAVESYAYAASEVLAEKIAARAGPGGLRRVWAAAADRRSAYQPTTPGAAPERTEGAPDWRGLLDLLEALTPGTYDDLWQQYVVRPDEASLLGARASARGTYAAVVARAGSWELPASIRQAMTAWRFDTADDLMSQASTVLDQRARIETRAAADGLTPPPTLREIFESDRGLRAAAVEAEAELAAMGTIEAAAAAEPPHPDLIDQLGLAGSEPDAAMTAARSAFATGHLDTAVREAEAARAIWTSARDVGTRRALSILGAALLLGLVLVLALVRLRGRRRQRRVQMAHTAAGTARPGVYGTLPAEPPITPDEPRGPHGGVEGADRP